MSVAWAVEHRPRRFIEVAGQEQITSVLLPMVRRYHAEGTFPQAFILYGPRGTGKTSVARILSKALNCQDSRAGEPCEECASCIAIREGRSAGVQEMDMASHGGVDNVREMKRSASFGLVEDWRVFLMDEVHSASREAFDAMLLLLEEPPPKTLFLLVTTEPDQIPETIQSRCMAFEFRRIGLDHIEARLRHVADQQSVAERISDDVYRALAVIAKGGMRDAVMRLEQVCQVEGPITLDVVKRTFGVTDLPERLLDAAVKGDLQRGLSVLKSALDSASPPMPILDGMLDGLTALLQVASGLEPDPAAVVSPAWAATHSATPPAQIIAAMKTLWDARARVQPGGVSAPSTLAVAYSLVVRDLAPAAFARAPMPSRAPATRPAAPGPVPAVPSPPAPPSEAPVPLPLEDLRKLLGQTG